MGKPGMPELAANRPPAPVQADGADCEYAHCSNVLYLNSESLLHGPAR